MGNNLQMSLKQEWFEMTKAGIKTEDYREITPYWFKRLGLFDVPSCFIDEKLLQEAVNFYKENNWQPRFKPFKTNIMTLGYPKSTDKERILKLEHKGIEIRTGNPEWGAESGKLYFVIKHGKII